MLVKTLILALSSVGCGAALQRRQDIEANISNGTVTVPKRYIIEFAPGTNAADLQSKIATRKGTSILKIFNSDVFSGIVVEATDDNVDTLGSIASVSQVWKSKKIKLETSSPSQIFASEARALNYSTHGMTGVDKLHDAGIYGKGAVVAVVDTGIQYTHPALGGGIGPGYKVAGGYDFVGDGCWPYYGCDPVPDSDPMDQIGHGTHVAGIIAAKSDQVTGVAPEATLLAYKVFTSYDGTDEDHLIEGFLAAYDAEADVITCSVGGAGGFADDAWAVIASRLVDKGVVVTIAASNNGLEGEFFGSIGSGQHSLSVASVEASVVAQPAGLATFTLNGTSSTVPIGYFEAFNPMPYTITNWTVIPFSLNTSVVGDACEPIPDGVYNFTNTVGLVRLGGCDAVTKQLNVQAAGSHYNLFYSETHDDTPVQQYRRVGGFAATIEARTGEAMVEAIAAGGSVVLDFATVRPSDFAVGMPYDQGGVANYFTTWGPLYDLSIKPDIAAPGGDILSTYPTDSYATMSGTSMATPYVAGVAALYIGKYGGRKSNPDFNATELVMRIMSSGTSLPWNDGSVTYDDLIAPVAQVGTGLVNGLKVLNYTTQLSFAKFELNDTHHFSRYHKVDITNKNPTETVTYAFDLEDGVGFETWTPYDANVAGTPRFKQFVELAPEKIVPTVSLPSAVKLAPGQTKTVQFNFNYPSGLSNIPLYGGKVLITSSLGEQLAVPYMGVASDLKANLKSQFQTGYPYITSGLNNTVFTSGSTVSFDLSPESQDFPKLFLRTQWGADELRWDIFDTTFNERSWTYPPTVGVNGYVGSATYWMFSGQVDVFDATIDPPANDTGSFPQLDVPRCSVDVETLDYWWFGQFANGTQIAPGSYIMRVAANVPFADRTHSDNWDKYTLPFTVAPLS